jgi:hypothetical protein
MSLLSRLGLALFGRPLRWVSSHPLRTSGAAVALVAGWIMVASLGVEMGLLAGLTRSRVVRFTLNHPAYPVAFVAGLATLLWPFS